jgi:hypothetical protein
MYNYVVYLIFLERKRKNLVCYIDKNQEESPEKMEKG